MTEKAKLVAFGTYLFSNERKESLKEGRSDLLEERFAQISDADVENFLAKFPNENENTATEEQRKPHSENLKNMIDGLKVLENKPENILVAIQYLEGAKREIERNVNDIPVEAEDVLAELNKGKLPDFVEEDAFNLDKMTVNQIKEFCKSNEIPLKTKTKAEMLDEIEAFHNTNKQIQE